MRNEVALPADGRPAARPSREQLHDLLRVSPPQLRITGRTPRRRNRFDGSPPKRTVYFRSTDAVGPGPCPIQLPIHGGLEALLFQAVPFKKAEKPGLFCGVGSCAGSAVWISGFFCGAAGEWAGRKSTRRSRDTAGPALHRAASPQGRRWPGTQKPAARPHMRDGNRRPRLKEQESPVPGAMRG